MQIIWISAHQKCGRSRKTREKKNNKIK